MPAWLELARACHCCSRPPGTLRPRTPWGGLTRQQFCSSTAELCLAPHRSSPRTKCPVIARASTSISQDVSSAGSQPRSELSRYEGLNWVNQQEAALHQADEPPVQPVPRIVDESHQRRHPYHRELLAALSRNSVEDVEDILQTMQEDDLEPGPLAYNTLVLAHIKGGDLNAAFDVLQDVQHQGLQPVPQTFCALIHSFVRSGQVTHAEEVLRDMEDSQISAYPGWLIFTKQLWAKGHIDLAQLYLKERPQEWKIDGDLYEHVIRHICTDASDNASYLLDPDFEHIQMNPSLDEPAVQEAAALLDDIPAQEADEAAQSPLYNTLDNIWRVMKENNVAVEARHCNPVLELAAMTGNFRSARMILDKMTTGSLAPPNAASYECLAEAYVVSNKGRLEEDMNSLTMEMTKLGLQPTKKMYSWSMEAALQANNLEMALAKLKGMREAGRGIMQRLSDTVLADLLWKLSSNNQPADLLRTLKTMQRDDKYLAQGPHNQHDQQGRSFLTAWLAAKPRASVQGFQGLPNQSALHVITQVDGYRVLNNKWILGKDDKVLATSNLTMPQLRAELKVRKLSTDGKRDDLKKRVMAARTSDPTDIALDVWKRQEAKITKQKKQVGREEAKRKKAQEAGADSGPSGKTEVVFQAWGRGGVTIQEKKEVKVDEDAEEGVVVDEADEGDADMTMDDPMQPASAATSEDTYGSKAEDGLDDDDGNTDDAHAVAVSAAAAPSQQVFSNQNAGLDAAMQLLRLTQSLNGAATAADYQTLLEAAEHENDANVAWSLVRSWHQTLQEAYDAETVERYYNRALKICKQATNSALALEVTRKMQRYGVAESATPVATA